MTQDTWDIASEEEEYYMEGQHRKGRLEQKLKEGWEPFAVTCEPRMYMGNETSTYVYHLKKKLLSKSA